MSVRPIAALQWSDIEPGGADMARPRFIDVAPGRLFVDESYQRNLSEHSRRLIRKIVADFDWKRFKPPVVVAIDGGYEVIDGQHTAIAAASHPAIEEIPVMVVEAPEREQRAAAFIGHNRDRLGVTAMQLHFAAVAAGDPEASMVAAICEAAGVRILRVGPGQRGNFKPGDTMAVAAIKTLCTRHGREKAETIVRLLARAELRPISAAEIRAAELLITDAAYCGEVEPAALTATIVQHEIALAREARLFSAAHKLPYWKALAVTWFRKAPKRRAARAAKPNAEMAQPVARARPAASPLAIVRPSAPTRALIHQAALTQVSGARDASSLVFDDPPPGRSALAAREQRGRG
jgi:hypothetical protein